MTSQRFNDLCRRQPRPAAGFLGCLSLLSALAVGCAVYNEECARFIDDPDGVTGYLAGTVPIDRPDVRLRENAIGQVVADAYYNAFNARSDGQLPQVAIVNGGAIRGDGVCEVRTSLPPGGVKRKVLRDILPYDNQVMLTKVSNRMLKQIFEHGMSEYPGKTPPGSFLQVSGARVTIDCSQQAQVLGANNRVTQEGQRIQSIQLRQRDCRAADEDACYGAPLDLTSETEEVYLALDNFIFLGGDGFAMFSGHETIAVAGSFNFEIVAAYFSEANPESDPLPAEAEARLTMLNCVIE